MDTIIIYDISDNSLRARVAKVLLDFGCIRHPEERLLGHHEPQHQRKASPAAGENDARKGGKHSVLSDVQQMFLPQR